MYSVKQHSNKTIEMFFFSFSEFEKQEKEEFVIKMSFVGIC